MAQYDFIQVEDDSLCVSEINLDARGTGLTYKIVSTLYDLAETLRQDDAGIWVIDGFFPIRQGARAEKNAQRAAKIIRKARAGASIIIYSSAPEEFLGTEEELMHKDRISPKELVTEIRRRLKG
jgi:hypothetical protein